MKTIDESGNIIENPDLEKGYLSPLRKQCTMKQLKVLKSNITRRLLLNIRMVAKM